MLLAELPAAAAEEAIPGPRSPGAVVTVACAPLLDACVDAAPVDAAPEPEALATALGNATFVLVPISSSGTEIVDTAKELVVDLVELEHVEQSWTVKNGLY